MNFEARLEKHKKLIAQWQSEQDAQALEDLLQDYQPLIKKHIRQTFTGGVLSLSHQKDLEQECNLAFIQAVSRYDCERNPKLTPYLISWLKGTVRRYSLDFQTACRLGTNPDDRKAYYCAQRHKAQKRQQGLDDLLTHQDIQHIANDSAVSIKVANRAAQAVGQNCVSLEDAPDIISDNSHLKEFFEQDSHKKGFALFEELRTQLDERTQDILCTTFLSHHIYGAVDRLADRHNLTPRRIRQLQKKGLEQLRILFEDKGYTRECF